MADPFTWIAIGTAIIGAYGAVQQGNAAEASAQAAAAGQRQQAELAAANAEVINQQAGQREEAQRRESQRRLGQMRGAIAQSGTGLGGSNADIYGQSARDAELDALNIRYAGLMESRGLLNQSAAARFNAKTAEMEGKSAKRAGYIRAGTSLLSANYGGMNFRPQTSYGPGTI